MAINLEANMQKRECDIKKHNNDRDIRRKHSELDLVHELSIQCTKAIQTLPDTSPDNPVLKQLEQRKQMLGDWQFAIENEIEDLETNSEFLKENKEACAKLSEAA